MAYISYHKLWRSNFYNNVFSEDRLQEINLKHLKLKVNSTHKKDEKITTNFKAVSGEDVINNEYLDTKVAEVKSL